MVAAAALWVESPAGTDFLRHRLNAVWSDTFAGTLEIDRVRISGFLRVEVLGARLFAPQDPIPVASIERLEVRVRAVELIAERIDIPKLLVEHPYLHIVHSGNTTNLELALGPVHPAQPAPSPPTPSRGPVHLHIHAPDVELRDGAFDMDGSRPLALDQLRFDAQASGTFQSLLVSAGLRTRVHEPAERDLIIDLRGNYRPDDVRVDLLTVRTGLSSVTLAGGFAFDLATGGINIEHLSLSADDVNAILPQARLLGGLQLRGNAVLAQGKAQANLEMDLPAGRLQAEASAVLGSSGRLLDIGHYRLRIGIDGVELQKLRPGLPMALAQVQLNVDGVGMPLQGTADVVLDASGSRFRHLSIDRLHLMGRLTGRSAHIEQLTVRAAAAVANAHGTAELTRGDLDLDLKAPALDQTRQLLAGGLSLSLPPMAGAAEGSLHVSGSWRNPHIELVADSPTLQAGDGSARGLEASVNLREIMPLPLGSFHIKANELHLAGRNGRSIELTGEVDGHTAALDAQGTFGNRPVEVVVRGERLSHRGGVEEWNLGVLKVSVLGVSVAAQQPAHIGWGRGRLRVTGLMLRGIVGHLALDGDVGSTGPVRGQVQLSGLNLATLPDWMVPSELRLAGIVALSADLRGTRASPDLAVQVGLAHGHFRQVAGAALDAQLRLAHAHLDALVHGSLETGGTMMLSAHGPWTTSLRALSSSFAERPVDVTFAMNRFPLETVHGVAPSLPQLGGVLSGTLSLSGSLATPALRAAWTLDGGSYAAVDSLHASLDIKLGGDAWNAALSVSSPHRLASTATLKTTVALRDLLQGDARAKERPLELKVALNDLNLAWLPLLGVGPSDLTGRVAGTLFVDGSLQAPVLNATLHGTSLGAAGRRDVDGLVDLKSTDEISLTMNAQMSGQPLVDLTARAKVVPARLPEMSRSELGAVPVQLNAELHPTPMERLVPTTAPLPGETEAPFRARLGLQLFVAGTANAPETHLHVDLHEARVNGQEVGVLTTDLDYRNALASFAAVFESQSAGTLHADAVLHANLGVDSIERRGKQALETYAGPVRQRPTPLRAGLAEVLASPVELAVNADRFDLSLANGFTGMISNLSGQMDLQLHKSGPLAPLAADGSLQIGSALAGLSGSLALSRARFSVLGSGSFSDVTLRADGSYPSLHLRELQGRAGEGTFHGHVDLTRIGSRRFQGALSLELQKIPIIVDFQTRGVLSLQIDGTATGSPGHLDIPELTLSHGHVVIPAQLPRHIQSLDPNPDFEIKNGPAPRPPPPKQDNGPTWVVTVDKITIPDDMIVEAPLGTKLTLGAQLQLVESPAIATKDEPVRLTGRITIIHGVLSLLKPFDVDKGTVTFSPNQLDNPAIDVKAHYDGPDVTIRVALSGTIQDLHKSFTSTPSMSENEILYYLATGQRQNQPQQTDQQALQTQMGDAALSALGAAAIGVVKGAVQSVLPSALNPDVLTVETDVAHQGIGRVRAGKYYLHGKLYVGGNYNPAANPALNQNTYEGEAQYRINAQNFIRLLVGNEGHHQLEYLYELNFRTKKQKENDAARSNGTY